MATVKCKHFYLGDRYNWKTFDLRDCSVMIVVDKATNSLGILSKTEKVTKNILLLHKDPFHYNQNRTLKHRVHIHLMRWKRKKLPRPIFGIFSFGCEKRFSNTLYICLLCANAYLRCVVCMSVGDDIGQK